MRICPVAPLAFSSVVLAASPTHSVTGQIRLEGPTRWDHVYVDQQAHVSHGTQTDIIDTRTDVVVGHLADTRRVHGVAVADDLGLVFTSNGADGEIDVYSLDTPLGQGTDRVT